VPQVRQKLAAWQREGVLIAAPSQGSGHALSRGEGTARGAASRVSAHPSNGRFSNPIPAVKLQTATVEVRCRGSNRRRIDARHQDVGVPFATHLAVLDRHKRWRSGSLFRFRCCPRVFPQRCDDAVAVSMSLTKSPSERLLTQGACKSIAASKVRLPLSVRTTSCARR
jgi:hypothetical protein